MAPEPNTPPGVDPAILELPFFDDRHREFARALQRWTDGNGDLWPEGDPADPVAASKSILRAIGAAGWLSFVDTEAAGPDGDLRSVCLARQILAHADDLADHVFAIQVLCATAISRYGTEEQRRRYLPGLAAGTAAGAFAVSEANAGSDVAAVALSADRTADGYVLNGRKCWIANADLADVHCVIARTGDGPGALGLTAFLVPADSAGLTAHPVAAIAPRSFGDLEFTDCHVPHDAVLGTPGTGFVIAMDILERARMTVGAAALGFARRAAQTATARAHSRPIYGGRLFDLQLVKSRLADMEISLNAGALLVARAAWAADHGSRSFPKHSSIAKIYATESAQQVVDDAVQILGAAGLVAGSRTERLYRQIRSLRVYEGATEVQKMIVADAIERIKVR